MQARFSVSSTANLLPTPWTFNGLPAHQPNHKNKTLRPQNPNRFRAWTYGPPGGGFKFGESKSAECLPQSRLQLALLVPFFRGRH